MEKISLPRRTARTVLALGGDLKCRPALAKGEFAYLGEEIGDLAGPERQDALEAFLEKEQPDLIVCDLHPGYYSTELALRFSREKKIKLEQVQHHRAHVAAVCLEHGLVEEAVVGLAFDGTGYGDDGQVWGGEFFTGSAAQGFERRAQFATLPVPGGDAAVREPWRIALALLLERETDPETIADWLARRQPPLADLNLFKKALSAGFALSRSSALGRWFDAAAALLGVGLVAAFEAEPAIKLQKLAEERFTETPNAVWPMEVRPGAPLVIDFPDLTRAAKAGESEAPAYAVAFHLAVAEAVAWTCDHLAQSANTKKIVASGGCFLNRLFDRLLEERLSRRGLEYLKPIKLPPGDQALAVGQLALALARLQS